MSLAHSKLHRRNCKQIVRLVPLSYCRHLLRKRRLSDSIVSVCRLRSDASVSLLKSSPRPISAGQLHTLLCFHIQPIYLVFFKGSYFLLGMRYFISGRASRLDAFSVYPFRTQLPGRALGRTTGTPLVRPLRSSRTRSSLPHVSCARDGYGPNCLTTF